MPATCRSAAHYGAGTPIRLPALVLTLVLLGPKAVPSRVRKGCTKPREAARRKGWGIRLEPVGLVGYRPRKAGNFCNSGRAGTLDRLWRWSGPDFCPVFEPPLKPGWSGSL